MVIKTFEHRGTHRTIDAIQWDGTPEGGQLIHKAFNINTVVQHNTCYLWRKDEEECGGTLFDKLSLDPTDWVGMDNGVLETHANCRMISQWDCLEEPKQLNKPLILSSLTAEGIGTHLTERQKTLIELFLSDIILTKILPRLNEVVGYMFGGKGEIQIVGVIERPRDGDSVAI